MTIWKFVLPFLGEGVIQMPAVSSVLHVGAQGGHICVWALVSPTAPEEQRRFLIAGTGHPLPSEGSWSYIGSVQQDEHVWHIFEPVMDLTPLPSPSSRFTI